MGDLTFEYPQYDGLHEKDAAVYMRPHELDIQKKSSDAVGLTASVARLNPAGAIARVHLTLANGDGIQVDLSQERFRELGLIVGETVFVYPKNARIFIPDYAI